MKDVNCLTGGLRFAISLEVESGGMIGVIFMFVRPACRGIQRCSGKLVVVQAWGGVLRADLGPLDEPNVHSTDLRSLLDHLNAGEECFRVNACTTKIVFESDENLAVNTPR